MPEHVMIVPEVTPQAMILRLTGTFGSSRTPESEQALLEMIATVPPPPMLVLDLSRLDLLTTDGARILLQFVALRLDAGVRCNIVVAGGSAAAAALDVADEQRTLHRFTSVAEALAAAERTAVATAGTFSNAPLAPENPMERLIGQLESLTRTLLNTTTVLSALRKIVHAAAIVVPAADMVSVTLRSPQGEVFTPAETDAAASALDLVQYDSGDGPCLDAAEPGGPAYALSQDLRSETRWPQFTSAALGRGYGGIISTELVSANTPDAPTGALNIYTHRHHALTDQDRYAALLLATHAALALSHSRASELAQLQYAHLRHAITTRDVIGQAKGILMVRQNITAGEAFELLRRTSQDLNVKLIDLATTLTDRHTDLDA